MNDSRFVPIGRLGSTYGFLGFVKTQTYGVSKQSLLDYDPLYWQQAGEWQPCPITERQQKGQQVIVKLNGYDTLEQAKVLANIELAIKHEQLPALPQGEYYWTDLEGLTVKNQQGIELGTVDHLITAGAHDVLVIKGEHDYLIPFVQQQYVLKVDVPQGIIDVDWDADFIATA